MKVSELFEAESIESVANAVYSAFANAPEARGCDKKRPEKEGDGMVVEFRYWGDWEVPEDEEDDGDYDWKVPTAKSRKAFDAILDPLKKKYPDFTINVDGGEKCYTTFFIKPKKAVKEAVKGNWKITNLSGHEKTFKDEDSPEAQAWMRNRGQAKQIWNGRYWVNDPKETEREIKKQDREWAKQERDEARESKPKKAKPEQLAQIHRKVEDAIGSSFPDGDPIDHFGGWLQRNGFSMDDVNAAFKKYEKMTYDKYLQQMWDDNAADAIHDAKNGHVDDNHWAYDVDKDGKITPVRNPWKPYSR